MIWYAQHAFPVSYTRSLLLSVLVKFKFSVLMFWWEWIQMNNSTSTSLSKGRAVHSVVEKWTSKRRVSKLLWGVSSSIILSPFFYNPRVGFWGLINNFKCCVTCYCNMVPLEFTLKDKEGYRHQQYKWYSKETILTFWFCWLGSCIL